MKVSELVGPELDLWVAKSDGYEAVLSKTHPAHDYAVYEDSISCWIYRTIDDDEPKNWELYEPSWQWHDGGPLIEKYDIGLDHVGDQIWKATAGRSGYSQYGETPLVAAMRALVSEKIYALKLESERKLHDEIPT